VNDEFDALRELLIDGFEKLKPGGRMAIISFHSLEDRIVKETFRSLTRDQKAVLVHKKPLAATQEELLANPRARSAKLRTIEKI
jgi:16S rRNA (cytosine1402-N4)-methyltransferase